MKIKQIEWKKRKGGTIGFEGHEAALPFSCHAEITWNKEEGMYYWYIIDDQDDLIDESLTYYLDTAMESVRRAWEKHVIETISDNEGCDFCKQEATPLYDDEWITAGIEGNDLSIIADIQLL